MRFHHQQSAILDEAIGRKIILVLHGYNVSVWPHMGSQLPSLGHNDPNMQQRKQVYGKPEL